MLSELLLTEAHVVMGNGLTIVSLESGVVGLVSGYMKACVLAYIALSENFHNGGLKIFHNNI